MIYSSLDLKHLAQILAHKYLNNIVQEMNKVTEKESLFFSVLGIETKACHMLGKYSTDEFYPQKLLLHNPILFPLINLNATKH
jgi:hypothetical protein